MALKWPLASVSSIMVFKFTSRLKVFLAHIANKPKDEVCQNKFKVKPNALPTLPRMKFNMSLQKVRAIKASTTTRKLTK